MLLQIGPVKALALRLRISYGFRAMQTVALEKAQANLADLVHQVAGGEEFTITQNGEPKAKLSAVPPRKRPQPHAGSLAGKIWMSPDFDAPLEDFKDYMK